LSSVSFLLFNKIMCNLL